MNTFRSPASISYASTLSYPYYVAVAVVHFFFGDQLIVGAFLLRPVLGISALVMKLASTIDWVRRRRRKSPPPGGARLLVGPLVLVVSGVLAARYLPFRDACTASETAPVAGTAPQTLSHTFSPSGSLHALLYAFQRYPRRTGIRIAADVCVAALAALVQACVLSLGDLVVVAAPGSPWWVGRVAHGGCCHHIIRWRRRVPQALIKTQADGGCGG